MPSVRLTVPSVVVLVGAAGAGKSTWAARWFAPNQVLASDDLRALAGIDRHDQRAGTDAFEVLDDLLARRAARRLTTVVDTTGLEADRRTRWIEVAHRHGVPAHAVVFRTDAKDCRSRNKRRARPVPAKVLSSQLGAVADLAAETLVAEGFDTVQEAGPAELVAAPFRDTRDAARRQADDPLPLRFGLHLSAVDLLGDRAQLGPALTAVARAAEAGGLDSLWVMDHQRQIPQVGRAWDDLPEAWTTLAHLAAATERVRVGSLVSPVSFRHPALLARAAATVDVLSGGRVVCGIGAGWFEAEHRAHGLPFGSVTERLDRLEDACEVLPRLWGAGGPAFEGRTLSMPDTSAYPRPLQDPLPLLVGGQGARRTLRLVARHAHACNLRGEPAEVAAALATLDAHLAEAGRTRAEVEVTHLSTVLVGADRDHLAERLAALTPAGAPAEHVAASLGAGTVADHVGRFRALAEAGVQTAIVRLADLAGPAEVDRLTTLTHTFPPPP